MGAGVGEEDEGHGCGVEVKVCLNWEGPIGLDGAGCAQKWEVAVGRRSFLGVLNGCAGDKLYSSL